VPRAQHQEQTQRGQYAARANRYSREALRQADPFHPARPQEFTSQALKLFIKGTQLWFAFMRFSKIVCLVSAIGFIRL